MAVPVPGAARFDSCPRGSSAGMLKHRRFQRLCKDVQIMTPPHALLPRLFLVKAALDELCEAAERTDDTPEVLSLLRKHTKVLLIITSLPLLVTV